MFRVPDKLKGRVSNPPLRLPILFLRPLRSSSSLRKFSGGSHISLCGHSSLRLRLCRVAFFAAKRFCSRRPDRLRVAAHQHAANLAAMSFAVFVDPFEHRGDIRELVADGLHYFNQIVRAVPFFFEIGQ